MPGLFRFASRPTLVGSRAAGRLELLYASLNARKRPEDIAQLALDQLRDCLSPSERACLQRAAKGSLKHRLFGYTSMLQEFAAPVGLKQQVATARDLFHSSYALSDQECQDPEAVERFIRQVGEEIRKSFGENDFLTQRMNHAARREAGMEISRRRYNKLFRHLVRMEAKLYTLIREIKKLEVTKISKSALASKLPWEEFSADSDTACFVAYYTARCNLRSEFTIAGQQRPYDEIAEMLFARCRKNPAARWWAIAHVLPSQEVLAHLSDAQKGELLGRWYAILVEVADLLRQTWEQSQFDRATMIVGRRDDSSTWNSTAGAWNRARDHWIALLYALEMEELLDVICPGKALRLMAADVAAWHRAAGGALHPDTAVWAELPTPWDVLSARCPCTREMVEDACRRHNVDPAKSGWSSPRSRDHVAAFRPTPELVHGVSIGSPFLAKLLREAGAFSGKKLKLPATFSWLDTTTPRRRTRKVS